MTDSVVRERFLLELRHHLSGWRRKVETDFAPENMSRELDLLCNDPIYTKFGLATPEYVAIRLMGRVSISIGRRLGEIYDKIPRYVAKSRFDLTDLDVAPKFNGLQLDIAIPLDRLSGADRTEVNRITAEHVNVAAELTKGLGIEIRYNFNPNDSSRLRKDCEMAELLVDAGLLPIYLVYSTISPRDEAIARLTRAGWHFLVGPEATQFSYDMFGMDFERILDDPAVVEEIETEVGLMMSHIYSSEPLRSLIDNHRRTEA
jgi:hypothetical protein